MFGAARYFLLIAALLFLSAPKPTKNQLKRRNLSINGLFRLSVN